MLNKFTEKIKTNNSESTVRFRSRAWEEAEQAVTVAPDADIFDYCLRLRLNAVKNCA